MLSLRIRTDEENAHKAELTDPNEAFQIRAFDDGNHDNNIKIGKIGARSPEID